MKRENVSVVRSDRRTVSISIGTDLHITVRAPRRMPEEDIDKLLTKKQGWIDRHLALQHERLVQQGPPLNDAQRRQLREQTRRLLAERLPALAARVGVSYAGVRVGFARTRFGSCSSRGMLSFHAALSRMPDEVFEYVALHELCHRKHMNHSPAFWAELERHCPDYRACRAWLKSEGTVLARM